MTEKIVKNSGLVTTKSRMAIFTDKIFLKVFGGISSAQIQKSRNPITDFSRYRSIEQKPRNKKTTWRSPHFCPPSRIPI